MAYTTYPRNLTIDEQFSTIMSQNGYVDVKSAYFLNQFVSVLSRSYKDQFAAIYALASQTDIATATGSFLDRWGSLLGVTRGSYAFAQDLTLSNVRLCIQPSATAGTITSDGSTLQIPAGTFIRDAASSVIFATVDAAVISSDRDGVYVRVAAATPGEQQVAAGTLTTVDFDLADAGNIIPSKAATYTLAATQALPISGGADKLDDEAYRYILLKKAHSWGVLNAERFQTLMGIPDVVSVSLVEVAGGVHVYLDTKHPSYDDMCVTIAQRVIAQFGTCGLHWAVFPPLYRTMSADIAVVLRADVLPVPDSTAISNAIKTKLSVAVAEQSIGTAIDLQTVLDDIVRDIDGVSSCRVTKVSYNGKQLLAKSIVQRFNEKAELPVAAITITVS